MTADLTLWFDDPEHWRFRRASTPGRSGQPVIGSGAQALAACIGHASADGQDEDALPRVTLLLPAARVLAAEVRVPARTRRQLLRALPFAVEERLAIDLDSVHIAHGPLRPNERTQVRVVDLAWFEAVLAYVRGLGLVVDAVHVDADCLPAGGDLTLFIDGGQARLRASDGRMLGVDRRALPFALARLGRARAGTEAAAEVAEGAASEPGLGVIAHVLADAPLTGDERETIRAAFGARLPPTTLEIVPVIDPLAMLVTAIGAPSGAQGPSASAAPIDLLQGRFAVRRALDIDWRPWKSVGIAAAALLVLLPLLDAGKAWRYGREAERLDAETQAYYQQLFPGEPVPRDLRRSFESRLGEDDGAALGFRPLLGALADGLGKARGFELQSVSYQRERDELAVQVLAGSLADLERFKGGFAAHRVVAEVSSAEQEQERVRARLRVHAEGSGGS